MGVKSGVENGHPTPRDFILQIDDYNHWSEKFILPFETTLGDKVSLFYKKISNQGTMNLT